jgi:hypothetical protein
MKSPDAFCRRCGVNVACFKIDDHAIVTHYVRSRVHRESFVRNCTSDLKRTRAIICGGKKIEQWLMLSSDRATLPLSVGWS